MKIAVLISGRAARYEACLLPILQTTKYDVDLYMSINDESCRYYDKMQIRLGEWLRGLELAPYDPPEKWVENINPSTTKQTINGHSHPWNCMSMYYNDMNAYNMASKTEVEYDVYLKFRSDIITDDFPPVNITSERTLFSAIPNVASTSPLSNELGEFTGQESEWVCDAIAYGNRESMKDYCDTYNFVVNANNNSKGQYRIHFESSLTDSIHHKKLPVEYFKYGYKLDRNRRILDLTWEGSEDNNDSRINNITGTANIIDVRSISDIDHIPPDPTI